MDILTADQFLLGIGPAGAVAAVVNGGPSGSPWESGDTPSIDFTTLLGEMLQAFGLEAEGPGDTHTPANQARGDEGPAAGISVMSYMMGLSGQKPADAGLSPDAFGAGEEQQAADEGAAAGSDDVSRGWNPLLIKLLARQMSALQEKEGTAAGPDEESAEMKKEGGSGRDVPPVPPLTSPSETAHPAVVLPLVTPSADATFARPILPEGQLANVAPRPDKAAPPPPPLPEQALVQGRQAADLAGRSGVESQPDEQGGAAAPQADRGLVRTGWKVWAKQAWPVTPPGDGQAEEKAQSNQAGSANNGDADMGVMKSEKSRIVEPAALHAEDSGRAEREVDLLLKRDLSTPAITDTHARTGAYQVKEGGEVADRGQFAAFLTERIEKIVQQQVQRDASTDMTVRIRIEDKGILFVGLRDEGQRIVVELRSPNQGLINLIQNNREGIVRNLESKNIYADLSLDRTEPDGFAGRQRRDERQGAREQQQRG